MGSDFRRSDEFRIYYQTITINLDLINIKLF
jgi:hypothetical protein